MKFRLKKYPIFLLVFLQLITFPAVADESCFTIIKKILGSIDQNISTSIDLNEHINQRIFIGNYAKKNNIPVFYKQNHAGEEIPFILVNRDSSKKLSHLIENSFGTDVTLQPKRNNDHGLLRAGNFIIDLDLPGLRGYGEINKTGLAWKNFSSYTEKRQFDADVILEIAYLVTPEEKKIIDFYQRIRRAAIFRVRFVLNNFKTEEQPFLLNTGNEHCFIFCKGQAVAGHIAELREKLAELGLKNIDDFFQNSEVISNIEKIKGIILNTDPEALNPEILNDPKIINSFNNLYPPEIKILEKKSEFLRWIISYEGSLHYNKVLKDLGISNDYNLGDIRNKRVSAVLVYDQNALPENFKNAQYSSKSASTPWPSGPQKPVE